MAEKKSLTPIEDVSPIYDDPPPAYSPPKPPANNVQSGQSLLSAGHAEYNLTVVGPSTSLANANHTLIISPQPVGFAEVMLFRDAPVTCTCPSCREMITTTISYVNGKQTFLICLIMCCVGLIFGCCLIPFFINECKDVVHICPRCSHTVNKYTRM